MRALLVLLALSACDAQPGEVQLSERHKAALRAVGIRDAQAAPYTLFVCDDRDSILASAGFRAGDVEGNVCCALLFKGCTVRTR